MAEAHYSVQFLAQAGYNVCLPCPESVTVENGLGPINVGGFGVHRNGFAGRVLLCQQRIYEGHLVAIVRCGGCGLKWALSYDDAVTACDTLREEAERKWGAGGWHLKVAERLMAGYVEGSDNA